ncbi:hypothetical protein K2173_007905 [Erythroxylum novogranatense]|uniref:CSC1-like protein RXW8 n=1 Tax=Erythroxylum novogranatense TaxID=1862640 RepID=A0AAV8T7U8_9ROSI|nr:hypothetical protein K2173_007905 [Erythroxylum novogranatense]
MEVGALLTSAGINIALCAVLFSLYSILRKQPSNRIVYFGRKLAPVRSKFDDHFFFERFVPSPSWLVKAWETSEDEILAIGGLDAVVFQRLLIFSMRAFSIASIVCVFLVLPVNYYGKDMEHKKIPSESLEVFSIENVNENSRWLGSHCLALYIMSTAACGLLYCEYKSITNMRLAHITQSPPNPSHFTVLVRSVPWSPGESYSDSVKKFFTDYYGSDYLSHKMVYDCSVLHKILRDAEKVCHLIKTVPMDGLDTRPSCLCAGSTSFEVLSNESGSANSSVSFTDLSLASRDNECPSAFVFFKTRYAAVVATRMLQTPNPMLWVTEMAPERQDVLWESLSIPFRQIWLRKIATILASTVFMFIFLVPVTFVQGLTQLDKLSRMFPFFKGMLKKGLINHLVTGYLPSVVLMLFLYTVPPMMMFFSSVEGPVSRSRRKRSACVKILYFTIWNVFFVNVLSGSVISQLSVFTSVRDVPTELAKAIPSQATFFMTYVLTSGWASLACELMQLFPLLCNLINKFILRDSEDSSYWLMSFPYHTEVPRVLLFGVIGFTCAVMAPLILPFLLVYFAMAYLVYRNQILNVYLKKYDSGGQYWPIVHNTTIFSLVLTQIITLGVFGLKESPVASAFTIPLIISTLLFHEYCRQRFLPAFRKTAAQVLIEMDRRNEQAGTLEEIHQRLPSEYCQIPLGSHRICDSTLLQDIVHDHVQVKSEAESSECGAVCNYKIEESTIS